MRIGATLLLRNGYCFQSVRWQYLRPLGSLKNAIKFLEKRNVDEIAIVRYTRKNDIRSDLIADIKLISKVDCITPLSFGGGIRNNETLCMLHDLPIERILLSSSYLNQDIDFIQNAIQLFGKQALISVLPYRHKNNNFEYYNCTREKFQAIDPDFIQKYSNEVLLYNTKEKALTS